MSNLSINISSRADVVRVLGNIVIFLYTIFFIVAVAFIILAAFNFLTAQGDPEKINNAKRQVYYAVVAIIVALVASSIRVIISSFLGGRIGQ